LLVGIFGVVAIIFLTNWLVEDVFLITRDYAAVAKSGFYVAAITIFLGMIGQVFSSIIQGVQRFDLYSWITTVTSFALVVGNLTIVFLSGNIEILLVWNLITVLCSTIAFFSISKRLQSFGNFVFDFSMIKKISIFGLGVTTYQLSGNIVLLFERSLIVSSFGEEALTFYVVPMTIGIFIHGLVASLTLALFPIASGINADESPNLLISGYMFTTKVVVSLVACICAILIASNQIVLKLWIGGELGEKFALLSSQIFVIQIITFGLLAIVIVSWILVEGVKDSKFNALQSIMWMLIGISSMLILSPKYESLGISIGRLIGVSIVPFSILIAEKWIFGFVLWRFWVKIFMVCGVAFGATYTFVSFSILQIAQNRIVFAIESMVAAFVFFAFLLLFGFFRDEERDVFWKALKL
jgi:O-antigen/teichoic acid export membrane protein